MKKGRTNNGQYRRKQIFVLGGVSGDSRISADTVKFSGWTFWASDSEHRVASYTSLAQIGVDTAALSETDFFNNIQTIINKMPAYSDLSFYCNVGANFTKSLNLQLIHDGISGAIENMEGLLMIKRRGVANWGVELMYQRNGGDLVVRGLYDVGGSSAVLYPFKVIATTEALNIKTYTALEQLNLSDADMAEDDFVGNLDKINAAIGDNACFVLLSDVPQFINSIVKQLKDDGINYSASGYRNINFKMERAVSMWNPIKIELFMDVSGNSNFHRDETIIGYANADGSGFKWYSFQKVAKVQPVIDITPLNGWEFRWFKMKKVDDMVTFIFTSKGIGVTKNGTVIGIVPEGYRPIENCSFSMSHNGSNHQGRIAIDTAGNIKIYNITDATE